jgi:predicted cation transporter
LFQINVRTNDSSNSNVLELTVDDADMTEAVVALPGVNRAKNSWVRIAAFNAVGLGPLSDPFPLEQELAAHDGNELMLENSARYTWIIALFGSLVFVLILVLSVFVYYRKRSLYSRKTSASNQVPNLPNTFFPILHKCICKFFSQIHTNV